jgi:uncharacterized membrane protein
MMSSREVVVCVFYEPQAARDALGSLRDAGFAGGEISLLTPEGAPESAAQADKSSDKRSKAKEGALTGLVAGGLFGGLAGWLIGLGSLAVPGVGPFIAAGALASALGGAAIGAGIGAVAGALIKMGVPDNEARYYEQEVRNGRSLIAVRGGKRNDEADAILRRHGGYDAQHPQATSTGGATRR